jgi:hypothetical protein
MAKHKARLNHRHAAYQQLHTVFPQAFPLDDADIRPLTRAARDELRAWIASQALDERTAQTLLPTLQNHCSRRTYQQVVANGGMRINLGDSDNHRCIHPVFHSVAQDGFLITVDEAFSWIVFSSSSPPVLRS